MKPKLLVFASGSKDGGGSGVRELIENITVGNLNADIVGIASNHEFGGVRQVTDLYCPDAFHFLESPINESAYRNLVTKTGADFVALSGWLKLVTGLNPATTINIHPGPLPDKEGDVDTGGEGMHGHHVHEFIIETGAKYSAVTMHFVTEKFDEGPKIFDFRIMVRKDETPTELAERVNKIEHGWQWFITNLVLRGDISWSGKKGDPVLVTPAYSLQPFCPVDCQVRKR